MLIRITGGCSVALIVLINIPLSPHRSPRLDSSPYGLCCFTLSGLQFEAQTIRDIRYNHRRYARRLLLPFFVPTPPFCPALVFHYGPPLPSSQKAKIAKQYLI